MNNSLSSSELLSAFLDGELDESATTTLFYTLAHDQELQLEMRQLIAIHNGFQSSLLTPPDALKNALHHRLGFPEVVPVPPSTGLGLSTAMGVVQGKLFLMFMTALATSLLTFLLVKTQYQSQPVHLAPQVAQLDTALPVQTRSTPIQELSRLAVPTGSRTVAQRHSKATISHIASRRESALTEHLVADNDSRIAQVEQQQSTVIIPFPETSPVVTATPVQYSLSNEQIAPLSDTEGDRKFSLSLRGFSGRSFPDVELEPLTEPPINNFAAGLLYHLDSHHALGVEMGQEFLSQRYSGFKDGADIFIEQNYLALWGGLSYRYTLISSSALQPYSGLILGGTNTGPMARLTLGAAYRLGPISLTAGVEGMLQAFRYQNRWFSTQKINATYGVSFYF